MNVLTDPDSPMPKPRRWQFSLRTFLLVATLAPPLVFLVTVRGSPCFLVVVFGICRFGKLYNETYALDSPRVESIQFFSLVGLLALLGALVSAFYSFIRYAADAG